MRRKPPRPLPAGDRLPALPAGAGGESGVGEHLENDDTLVKPFRWARARGLRRFADLDLTAMRTYRAELTTRIGKHGRRLRPHTVLDSHRALLTFLRWARAKGHELDPASWS